jgi:peptide/nickel transport system substrate-binding protein/microcin C transport system substrate-binding protein
MKSQMLLIGLLFLSQAGLASNSPGNPEATKGGTFYISMSSDPATLNPISAADVGASEIHDLLFDTTLTMHLDTNDYQPGLAERWEISKDLLSYTFYLRKDAKFSDGHPVTAEDVKFTYDAIFDPKFNAAHKRSSLENLDRVEVVDPYTVRFVMKKKYFRNFEVLATYFIIIPKHIYEGGKNQKGKIIIGSGPYVLEKWDRGRAIILKKNPLWWGWNAPYFKGFYNFDKIHVKIVKEDATALAMAARGDLDLQGLTAEQFVKNTEGGAWGKTVLKSQVAHNAPKGYSFIGWNLKNEMFKDKKTRQALAHLMNRELMIEKFRYNKSELATGPWYRQSEYADQSVKPFKYDPKAAVALLRAAGWADTDKDGTLDKVVAGKKLDFKFSLLSANKDFEKYLTIYKEDLKKSGIDMNIVNLEWNAFVKKLDEMDFDAVGLAWGRGSNEIDPRQLWHSSSAVTGGSNFISYKNPVVDRLTDEIGLEFDKKKRTELLKKVYRTIADDAPYVFLFNDKYVFYARSSRAQQIKPTFKYGIGQYTWWMAPAK